MRVDTLDATECGGIAGVLGDGAMSVFSLLRVVTPTSFDSDDVDHRSTGGEDNDRTGTSTSQSGGESMGGVDELAGSIMFNAYVDC
jgi:hypothetical protein